MTEASWGEAATPEIDWKMSAALEKVPRGESELAEVTSLEGAVREWVALDPANQEDAILTPERPLLIDGVSVIEVRGDNIGSLAHRLPGSERGHAENDQDLDDAG